MSEHDEQVALFEWAAWQVNLGVEPLRWLFAIPNGGLRNKATAGKLKAEGVKAGVPDVMLPFPSQNYNGLFIEMKFGNNKPTPKQIEWLAWLNGMNYQAKVARGFEEAKQIIEDYLLGLGEPYAQTNE
ncbi:hypothetical protein LCGC14_1868590 [marine sediment metagenome]|uniref:VRR-NUC domain-containing protein n=1 Tax=marine sediment metagenome TaxID=412755 RepID=A0A0F9G5K1_9ZZZZ